MRTMWVKARQGAGCWLVVLLAVLSLAAGGSDFRLVEAVKNRDSGAIQTLLREHVDVNIPQADGTTPLQWAAQWDDLDTAELLIRAGASVSAANEVGYTALWLACTNGNAAMVVTLLKSGANANAAVPTGETALMTAARTGKVGVVNVLLDRGADVNAKERSQGQTALMWAAAEGHAEVAEVLVKHGANVRARSKAGFTPLIFAARVGDLRTARILLAAGADVNEASLRGTTALLVAAIRGHLAFAEFLLDRGANPNAGPGYTPLHWAAGENWGGELSSASTGILAEDTEWSATGGLRGPAKLAFVKLLLAHGADPNARARANPDYTGLGQRGGSLAGATPFLIAAEVSDIAVMRVLLASGADPLLATDQKTTALMAAAGVGYTQGISRRVTDSSALEAVKLCLELGNDVNGVNEVGETPLHGAAYREEADAIVRFLVEQGADLNAKDKRAWTPLVVAEGIKTSALFIRSASTAALLLKLGAEPSPPDVERDEPTASRLANLARRTKGA